MAGAHTVKVSPSIPATVEIERGRLFGLVVGIAALTAAVTWALSAYAFDSGSSTATPATKPIAHRYMSYFGPHPATATDTPPVQGYMSYLGQGASVDTNRAASVGSYFPTPQDLAQVGGSYTIGGAQTQDAGRASSIMSLTPAGLAANALGTGYVLPSAQQGPSVESVLASMSPQTREYTKRIMNLTFAQLGAGAAGAP